MQLHDSIANLFCFGFFCVFRINKSTNQQREGGRPCSPLPVSLLIVLSSFIMSGALTEFSVRLTVTSSTNSLAPALEWMCRQTDDCFFATASLATTATSSPCTLSNFETYSEFSENLLSLSGSTCNEILLENGSTLNYLQEGGQSCVDGGYEHCPAVFYRWQDGRNKDAVCPGGTEMVLSVVGTPTSPGNNYQYILTPSPGLDLLNDDGNGMPLLDGCTFVGDSYICDSGTVSSFRFTQTSSFCDATDVATACPFASLGIPYGYCGGTCQQGPPLPPPQEVGSFSATLTVTSSTNSLAPALEWICRADVACTTTDPTPDTNGCPKSSFDDYLDYQEHLPDLTGSACHEIVIRDASALFGFDRCERDTVYDDGSGADQGSTNACGAVIYRYQDGRNKVASCPSGTEMQLSISGIPNTGYDYIVRTSSPTEVTLVSDGNGNGDDEEGTGTIDLLPVGCQYVAESYRCASGFVTLRFSHSARPCNGELGNCPFPTSGYFYGACGVGPDFCSAGPTDDSIPDETIAGDEFEVQLVVTGSTNSLAPALEWYCRLLGSACSLGPDSLSSAEAGICTVTSFDTLTDYNENVLSLASIGGCHQIVLTDGAAVHNDDASCANNRDGNATCSAVLYRHADGRNDRAVCPSGTEMVVSAVGTPGAIDYIFRPSSLVDIELSLSEIPAGCDQIADGYRCSPGAATLRFTQRTRPCTESYCPLQPYGVAYGDCGALGDGTCYENIPAADIAFPTTVMPTSPAPTRMPVTDQPTLPPTARPTTSPSAVPSAIPSSSPSAVPSAVPSASPSSIPSSTPSSNPTKVPTSKPESASMETTTTSLPTLEPVSAAPRGARWTHCNGYFVLSLSSWCIVASCYVLGMILFDL